MDKPGNHNMQTGAFWLIAGAVLTIGTYWILNWQGGILFYGAILIGTIQLFIGLLQRIAYELKPAAKKEAAHTNAAIVTLLRCMAMVANADGRVDDREIGAMQEVLRKLTGSEVSAEAIRAMVEKVGAGGGDPVEFVASQGTQASVEHRVLIAKACYLVLLADGSISADEERMLDAILDALLLPRDVKERLHAIVQ